MLSLRQLLVILAAIQGFQYGARELNLYYLSPLRIIVLLINIITEVILRVFIAYNFPKIFIFWLLVTDKEFQRFIGYIVSQIKNKINKKGNLP
jgi:hypothetical protein